MLRALTLLVCTSLSALGQARKFVPEDHYRIRSAGSPELSPDGSSVAYVESALDADHRSHSQLWLVSLAGGARTLLSGDEAAVSAPRWAPDGKSIAFISPARGSSADGVSSIVVVRLPQLNRDVVTTFQSANEVLGYSGTGEQYAWAPDGRSIAYLAADAGAEPPPGDPQVITRYHYKTGTGVSDNRKWHIYLVNLADRKSRALTSDARYHDLNLAFSPRGDEVAFASNRTADPDRVIDLNIYVVRVSDGSVRQVTRSPISEYAPRWSPDGSQIAYLRETTLKSSRETRMNDSHVWVGPAAGGPGRDISASLDRRTGNFAWSDDSSLVFTVADHGNSVLYRGFSGARKPVPLVSDGTVGAFSASRGNRIAYVYSNAGSPGDVFVKSAGDPPRSITHVNADLMAARDVVEPIAFTFRSVDGLSVQGFLTPPLDRQPGRKYPLIVQIHGGPHGQQGPAFNLKSQVYAGVGWATVMINYRGSSGYGQKFAEGTYRDWNGLEGKDVLAGIDSIIARTPWLDARRVSLEGGSYGGQLTNWLITQRQSFRSAIPSSGISNLVTEAYMIFAADYAVQEYGDFVWQKDIAQQMWNRSALNHVGRVKTPVMFIHGLLDQDVPIAEAQMYYLALKQAGVETVLVQYPREGHGLREPGHIVDAMQRSIAWHGRFLGTVQ